MSSAAIVISPVDYTRMHCSYGSSIIQNDERYQEIHDARNTAYGTLLRLSFVVCIAYHFSAIAQPSRRLNKLCPTLPTMTDIRDNYLHTDKRAD